MTLSLAAKTTERLRTAFANGLTRPVAWREEQLRRLMQMLSRHAEEISEALSTDLGKPVFETQKSETGYVAKEAEYALHRIKKWVQPRRIGIPLHLHPGRAWVQPEPYGVALIIAPWNFPIQLSLTPLVAALAAGNCAILKPSEYAPAASGVLNRLLPQYLDNEAVAVIEGDAETAKALLRQNLDYIFYTGSTTIGRKVMAAAAAQLTPVTLELGGKCPCVVDSSANLEVAARRIVWGKFLNAGQTCVAPDYVLVQESVESELLQQMRSAINCFFTEKPASSPDYGRIVNDKHFQRLFALLQQGKIVVGGDSDRATRYIGPTILQNPVPDSPVMEEEIFGPILPVISVPSVAEAIAQIKSRPKPLALYLFSADQNTREQILQQTSSGGVCVNDTILHLSTPELPFGGVGESGIGRYHGRAGFETFSHDKTVFEHRTWLDPRLRYPPYDRFR